MSGAPAPAGCADGQPRGAQSGSQPGSQPGDEAGARFDALFDALAARIGGRAGSVGRSVPLAGLTTYHLGGPVAVLVRVGSQAGLSAVATVVAEHRPALLFVGRGSNLLLADAGFAGLGVVLEGEFEAVDLEGEPGVIHAGAAVPLPVLARRCAAAGLGGLEFFVGIPGSVGGAVRMNAGGHGRETADVLVSADVLDLAAGLDAPATAVTTRPAPRPLAALGLGYRHAGLAAAELVTGARFTAAPAPVAECERAVAEIVRWRREHQPGGANAGSVFANPAGDSAGRLIDATGLKGLRVGGAVVSDKHANFFQAEAGATADDVHRLVLEVQRRVRDATGVELHPELRMVGFAAGDPGAPG